VYIVPTAYAHLVFKQALMTPDFDKQLEVVNNRSRLYAIALQTKAVREQQYADLLDWICGTEIFRPQSRTAVGDTCHWFFDSSEYLDWVGEDPSTLICSGKRTSPAERFLTSSISWRGEITPRVRPYRVYSF
jgi:hypothetical protein